VSAKNRRIENPSRRDVASVSFSTRPRISTNVSSSISGVSAGRFCSRATTAASIASNNGSICGLDPAGIRSSSDQGPLT